MLVQTLFLLYGFPLAENNKHKVVFKISRCPFLKKKKKRILAVHTYTLILELIKLPESIIIIIIVIITYRNVFSP